VDEFGLRLRVPYFIFVVSSKKNYDEGIVGFILKPMEIPPLFVVFECCRIYSCGEKNYAYRVL
jgi:hypothetical protein